MKSTAGHHHSPLARLAQDLDMLVMGAICHLRRFGKGTAGLNYHIQ